MRCLKIIIVFISTFVCLYSMHEGPVRAEDPVERDLKKSELNARENEIKAQKEKIERLESEKKYSEAKNEGESLKKLLDQQINDLRKFSIDFPSERESANISEGKAEIEKEVIENKIKQIAEEIKRNETDISNESTIEKVEFSIFKEGLKNDKTVSSKWKDRLELFYNKIKLKVNELPVIGNPKKALAIREKLNGIYGYFDQIGDQINNLQGWEDYLINSALVERDYKQVQDRLVAMQRYINRLESVNKRIANNELGANNEKLAMQQKALSEIVLKTAFDLKQFSEEFKRFENVLSENQIVKKTVQNALQDIQNSMNDLLNEKISLNDYFKTDNEKKQIDQDQAQYIKNFLTPSNFSNFGKLADRLVKTLAIQPAGLGVFANFPEYKELRNYLNSIEGFDTTSLINSKELNDWQIDAFAKRIAGTYSKIAEGLEQRYEKLSKISPRTAKINDELSYINDTYNKMVDGLEKWLPIEEAFEYKILANAALKGPRNEQEKIARDNLNVNTKIKEITDVFDQLQKFKKRLFDSKRSGEIVVLNDFLKTFDEFSNKTVELLALVNNPTTAPSRDALKKMKQLLKLYKQIQGSIESYAKTTHSFEDAPSLEQEDELVKRYLDILTKREILTKRIAVFKSALLVVGQDGKPFPVDQIDKEYLKKMGDRDSEITNEEIRETVKDVRDAAQKTIKTFSPTQENLKNYKEILFNTYDQFPSESSGTQLPDDEGNDEGGYGN